MERVSSAELSEWIEYYRLEPFGEERADLRAGIVASTIANCHVGKRGKAFKPSDFMPFFEKETSNRVMSQNEISAMCSEFRAASRARKKRG